MGRLTLRATHCLHCGTELTNPSGKRARIDRTYCAESCRVLAYRVRRQHRADGNPDRTPKRPESRPPLLHKALSALAELQAQIVDIGQTLREEDLADKKQYLAQPTVDHEAEKESLRRQLTELTEKLHEAQARNTELEGIVKQQSQTIQDLEAQKPEQSKPPATALQLALHTLAQEITRDEERWLIELGEATRSGYEPKSDQLLDRKFDELRAEQDLADAEERAGGVPSIRIHRGGILLWPMAMFAAMKARQEEALRQHSGLLSRRPQIRLGQLLRPDDEGYLCKLSEAQTRDLMRKLPALYRR
jgi:hypothetical protein